MTNLIPPEAKKKIVIEYWVRVTSVWFTLAAGTAIVIAILLLPAYVSVTSQKRAHETMAAEASAQVADYDSSARLLAAATTKARLFIDGGRRASVIELHDVIRQIADANGMTINHYEYQRKDGVLASARIEGVAPTRLSLANFSNALNADSRIEKVDLPISNLAKDRDIMFGLQLVLATSSPITP